MRVARYYNNNDVRLEEMPVPEIGRGELLVQVEACGICGSDVMEWYRRNKAPLVLGHELAGKVVEGDRKGERVTIAHHVPCFKCKYCVDGHETCCDTLRKTNIDPGGFSEFVRVPAVNAERGVFIIPDHISYEEATFTEPVACVLRAFRIARLKPGQSVLVIGSGIAGLLSIIVAKALGAGLIMAADIVPYRIEMAKRLGADTNIRSADLVMVCTGAETALRQALGCVERGGVVLFFAPTGPGVTIPISINDLFFRNDITLTTSYAGSPKDYKDALELISSRKVNVKELITHRFGLADTQKGFQLVAKAQDSVKVIIEPRR